MSGAQPDVARCFPVFSNANAKDAPLPTTSTITISPASRSRLHFDPSLVYVGRGSSTERTLCGAFTKHGGSCELPGDIEDDEPPPPPFLSSFRGVRSR